MALMDQLSSNLNRTLGASPYGEVIHFRCSAPLPTAIRRAAKRRMISASAYMRQALIERLKTDGVDLKLNEDA
jgi:hypothetical protein